MKTKALISFAVTAKLICVFVFAYAKSRFSHDEAQIKAAYFKTQERYLHGQTVKMHSIVIKCTHIEQVFSRWKSSVSKVIQKEYAKTL